jgi:hypothetical protein
MTLYFILHYVVVSHSCSVAMIRPSHTLIDMTYCRAKTKATPASVQGVASINRSIRISLLHNVVKRVRNSTARFRCDFWSTDGPVYDSAHNSSHLNYKNFPYILGYLRLPFRIFWCN